MRSPRGRTRFTKRAREPAKLLLEGVELRHGVRVERLVFEATNRERAERGEPLFANPRNAAAVIGAIDQAVAAQPDAMWIVYRKGLILEKLGDTFTSFSEGVANLLTRLFGSSNERHIRKLGYIRARDGSYSIVPGCLLAQVNALEEHMLALSDEELRGLTSKFRERLAQGAALEDLLPEAFAACREAARRTKNMRHFDVQILGGIAMHYGSIVEMQTGEGKTLVSTAPAYLNALTDRGVHIVTVNDYLARRDAERLRWIGRDQFDRLCWTWMAQNRAMRTQGEGNPRFSTVRFEDLVDRGAESHEAPAQPHVFDHEGLDRVVVRREVREPVDHAALVQNHYRLAYPLHVPQEMRRQQNGLAMLLAQSEQELKHGVPARRIEAGRRLIEGQDRRVVDQGLGQLDPLFHSR